MDAKFYVPYKTARELRLKGYPQSTETWYVETAKGVRTYKKPSAEYESIARPTYHEVLDWLTGKGYYIHADIDRYMDGRFIENSWYAGVAPIIISTDYYPSREDALNAAILETLKRL